MVEYNLLFYECCAHHTLFAEEVEENIEPKGRQHSRNELKIQNSFFFVLSTMEKIIFLINFPQGND